MTEESREMSMVADSSLRSGVFSDYMIVKNVNGKSVLDFFLIDDISDKEGTAVLTSRVVMTYHGLVALRDMLDRHIKATGIEES